MQNERERSIEELLAHAEQTEASAPRWPKYRPDCPPITEVMDTALEQAAPEIAERVRRHLTECDFCQACFDGYLLVLRDEQVPEPPLAGSVLELVADGNLKPKPRPEPPFPAPAPSPVAGLTGFTALYRAGRLADLKERLQPWLPFLLRWVGLADQDMADLGQAFLAYIQTRLDEVQHRRFRELLPEWLRDFAGEHHLTGHLRLDRLPKADELEPEAVRLVLQQPTKGEANWATAFRKEALQSSVPTAQELLAFDPAGVQHGGALPNYRRDLVLEVRRRHRDGSELLECELTS